MIWRNRVRHEIGQRLQLATVHSIPNKPLAGRGHFTYVSLFVSAHPNLPAFSSPHRAFHHCSSSSSQSVWCAINENLLQFKAMRSAIIRRMADRESGWLGLPGQTDTRGRGHARAVTCLHTKMKQKQHKHAQHNPRRKPTVKKYMQKGKCWDPGRPDPVVSLWTQQRRGPPAPAPDCYCLNFAANFKECFLTQRFNLEKLFLHLPHSASVVLERLMEVAVYSQVGECGSCFSVEKHLPQQCLTHEPLYKILR